MRERLRRLRREDGPATRPAERAGPAPAGADALPGWFRERGRRAGGFEELADDPSLAPKTVGEPNGLTLAPASTGLCAARVATFAAGHRHGDWRLDEVASVDPGTLALVGRDPALAGLELERAVFLDIETTGLSGGAGTVPYLVGLGSFGSDGVELWQGFVRSPEEEPAMLEHAAARIRQSSGVVTFFGKSFDRHRLEDKMTIYGIAPPFADRPHLDLYHACHRLYARAFADGRLSTMERELCGVERTDDLSGAFAPAAWFDYLAGRAHRLEAVFRHNLDDVLSLITLSAHVGRVAAETRGSGQPLCGPGCVRAAALARLCAARKARAEREAALAWIDRALARAPAGPLGRRGDETRELALERARVLRGLGRDGEARAALQGLLADDATDRRAFEAWRLLAIVEEHATKDLAAALVATLRAEGLAHLGGPRAGTELAKRRARLERKLLRAGSGGTLR